MSLSTLVLILALPGAPLTLDEAVRAAEAHQPQIQQAQAQTRVAEARVEQGRAPLLPQVTGTASYQQATANPVRRAGPSSTSGSSTPERPTPSFDSYGYFNFGVTASQLLYDFGQAGGRYRATQASLQAQKLAEQSTRLDVVLNVRQAFFGARAQKELVRVAQQTVQNQKRHLDQIQAFVEVKTRPEIDLAQAKLDMANAQMTLITAENGYQTSKAQLNQAMGLEQGTEYEVADETVGTVAGEEASTDQLLNEAIANRPDLASLRKSMEAQRLTVRAVQGGYGPSLSVQTSLTEAGSYLNDLTWNWSGMATLSWPIFQGFQTRGQVHEAQANLSNLTAQQATLRQQVRLAIEQARLSIRSAKAALEVAQVAVDNANLRLNLAEARYQAGAGSIIELGDAQIAATNAAAQKVQAEYTLSTARAQLLQALGRR